MPVNQAALVGSYSIPVVGYLQTIYVNKTTLNNAIATASVTFSSDGTVDSHQTNDIFNWLVSGTNSQVQIKVDPTEGVFTTGTTGTWLTLDTTRTWTLQDVLNDDIPKTCIATVRLRNATTLEELVASVTMTLEADRDFVP